MKNKLHLIIGILLISNTTLFAQTYIYYGDRAYGTNSEDVFQSMMNIGNGHLVIAGGSAGNVNGDKTGFKCDSLPVIYDIWILKIDTAFNIIWDKDIGGESPEAQPYLLYKKTASQIMISCSSRSDSICEKTSNNRSYPNHNFDYWISNMDTNGNMVNDFTWGGNFDEHTPQTIALSTGSYITCGISNTLIDGDKTVTNYDSTHITYDYWIIKTDSSGNKLWDNHYGGSGNEFGDVFNLASHFNILNSEEDNFIVAGTTNSLVSGNISDSSRGMQDIWIIKIDSLGNKMWDKRYGGSANDNCEHIIKCNDGGYILCGSTISPQGGEVSDSSKGLADCWVVKLDPVGNKQWDKRYGGNNDDIGTWIERAPGGGYWVSGQTASDSSGDVTEAKYGNSDYWIFKIDDAGNKLWDKRFGGPLSNIGSAFVIMPDGSIFLGGSAQAGISAVKADSGKGDEDYWIVHFKYIDSLSTSGISTLSNFSNNISVFPNPAKDVVTITSATEKIKSIALINLLGETLFEQKVSNTNTTQLNLHPYPQGFYFLKIKGANYTVTKKVLLQR